MAEARAIHGLTREGQLWLLAGEPGPDAPRTVPVRVPWEAAAGYGQPLLLGAFGEDGLDAAEAAATAAGVSLADLPCLGLDAFVGVAAGTLLNSLGALRDPLRMAGRLGVLLELDGRGHVAILAAGRREAKWTNEFDALPFAGEKRLRVPGYIADKRLRVPEADLICCGFGTAGDDYSGLARGLEYLAERYGFFDAVAARAAALTEGD